MSDFDQDKHAAHPPKKQLNPAVGFGSTFAGGMAVFGLGGHWLDGKTGREPLFTLLGIGAGLLFGAWEVWKVVAVSRQQPPETSPESSSQRGKDAKDSSH